MADINIPGITDKYKTNDTVEKLMQIEKIPLTREQKTLETYKKQQDAWRDINRKVSTLRDSVKTLYSFENPFNNKITSSTEEYAVTATATRNAAYDSFKVDVIQTATSDRFLTSELDESTKVPKGTYTYKIGDKTVTMRWKGGSLQEFSNALNRRGNNLLRTRIIGAAKGKKALAIESLKTGEENRLSFEDDAKTFAEESGMIVKINPSSITVGANRSEYTNPPPIENNGREANELRETTDKNISVSENGVVVPPGSGYKLEIPETVSELSNYHLKFSIVSEHIDNSEESPNDDAHQTEENPFFSNSGSTTFRDITIFNAPIDAHLPQSQESTTEEAAPIETSDVLFARMKDGTETHILTYNIVNGGETKIDLPLSDYPEIESIVLRNFNTETAFIVSAVEAYNPVENLGFVPQNPISTASDAIIKYEGITIKRPENTIDDIVPDITLTLLDKTDKTATISVKPDVDAAKDALITFVGQYNQAIAQINILSQNKEEIIAELDYLTEDEQNAEKERLGMFLSDSSLTSLKSSIQAAVRSQYNYSDGAEITMLSQIGISTNASNYSGYTPSKLRGYLEIDEKKLDAELETHLDDIKNLFGYDTDGDLVIDSGIGYRLDSQLTGYVQSGGIFSMKTSSLDSRIKSSEQRISRLESQMADKEAELRNKYGQMESTLNSLENQQSTIMNFSNRNNNK